MSDNQDERVFIYALKDPRNGAVVYVGQTVNMKRRLSQHYVVKWQVGATPDVEILESTDKEHANEAERAWVRHFIEDGASLTNDKLVRPTCEISFLNRPFAPRIVVKCDRKSFSQVWGEDAEEQEAAIQKLADYLVSGGIADGEQRIRRLVDRQGLASWKRALL